MSCDALIVGAGPAGSTAAILLARAGWKVVLAERAAFPRRKVCGEYISGAAWPLLDALGVGAEVAARAGPVVTAVGFFARETVVSAPMPAPSAGRALGREHLDMLLARRAVGCGARFIEGCDVGDPRDFDPRLVVRAHGSWHGSASEGDLLGFKAHFRGGRLAAGLMPLIVFDGGYGGMVHTDDGRVSLSCCVRRSTLARIRALRPGMRAGEALLGHLVEFNRGVREVLGGAALDGAWLAAGPVRPAIRRFRSDGAFFAGNAAGEAHPIIAEGISMAIQSSFLLCERLVKAGARASETALGEVARSYEAAWRESFRARFHAARLFAAGTTHPIVGRAASRLLERLPAMLTLGAHWSGKDVPPRMLACPRP